LYLDLNCKQITLLRKETHTTVFSCHIAQL
jgi:hypothetical protein